MGCLAQVDVFPGEKISTFAATVAVRVRLEGVREESRLVDEVSGWLRHVSLWVGLTCRVSRACTTSLTDPSGGSADPFTLAIAHAEKRGDAEVVVIGALRERRPPLDPSRGPTRTPMH